ncbi:DUF4232 domain-containing protein [Streptomyces subrutilus]|uniref:DUF4232 domain-containing protein n=1 Tax=Streptomyces subrutilus TaxID=36818 RepID=A0A5P2ULE6_9ACTN|nr:DUF4232 domain-containing protein [Streptomyces subrutilus]QEU77457.1 DUF4232 domain-containing protein [Streptomyces subrutilus]WSJ33460.1 DUF4232 domain-containing protein [Streptomyces subrutilus]GGZ47612.1 hypothetical protein GCM10010371_03690 [Streptomyces subrutilus]
MRTNRTSVAVVAAVLAALAGAGTARAATPADSAAPSACRPANHLAKIARDQASSGHTHFRVTLTAPKGYAACTLAGSPTDVAFAHHGTPVDVTAGRYGDQSAAVTFGPGRPVHFDIQVPSHDRGIPADEVSFTLRAPDGVIPGTSVAEGPFTVTAGTVIGPIRPGA